MLLINSDITNPNFNLAMEEYFLKNFHEDIFMLWRNEPAIIVGKNQNALNEINIDFVKEHNIPVIRRLTGGGAVFHDLGNINFTFISGNASKNFNNFRKFTQPIINLLNSLNINAEFSGRNDLTIDGKKFSGNAQCNYKDKVMHHGTLLFSSDIQDISDALKVNPVKLKSNGVKSVVSRVTNISQYLTTPMTVVEFKNMLMNYVGSNTPNSMVYNFTKEDIKSINGLITEKYGTWRWNFGESPNYDFSSSIKYIGGNIDFNLNVYKGAIKNIKIYGDFFGKLPVDEIEKILIGVNHEETSLLKALNGVKVENYFSNITKEVLVNGLLGKNE